MDGADREGLDRLRSRDILQINATLIAGLLIFLSIPSITPAVVTSVSLPTGNRTLDLITSLEDKIKENSQASYANAIKVGAASVDVGILTLSCIQAIGGNTRKSLKSLKIGLVVLAATLIAIAVANAVLGLFFGYAADYVRDYRLEVTR